MATIGARRAAAAGCLPSLPAPMLAEVAAIVSPEAALLPPPGHEPTSLVPAEPGRLARRLALLAGGANMPLAPGLEAVAARLADGGAGRIGGAAEG